MVAKSIAKMYTNIHKPTDYYVCSFGNAAYNLTPKPSAFWHPHTFIMVHPTESPSLCWADQIIKGIHMSLSDAVLATHDRSWWRSLVRGAAFPATRATSRQTFLEQLPRSVGETDYTERHKLTADQ